MMIPAYSPLMRSHLSRGVGVVFASSQHIVSSLFSDGCATSSNVVVHRRNLGARATIGSDPLDVLRKECAARKRCDDKGQRLKTTEHWALSIAMASSDTTRVSRC